MLGTLMGIRSVLARAIIMALVYVETCVTLIYILSIWEAREFQGSLTQRAQLLGSGPSVGKNVQMAPVVDRSIHC